MTARILSGREIADSIKAEVAGEIIDLKEVHGFTPCLVAVQVGNNAASSVYVGNKIRTSQQLGLASRHRQLPEETSQEELLAIVRELNESDDVDGILVQLPLPDHIDENLVLETIEPGKDVDGFHPINVGRLSQGQKTLAPCTPAGVIQILKRSDIDIAGQHAVVVGRSNIVGKPMAALLLRENATVTICHSRTRDLSFLTNQADILIAAVGKIGFIKAEHIRPGATVIDVGINELADSSRVPELFPPDEQQKRYSAIETRGFTLIGDVNQRDAAEKAGSFTPVPGGVGLLTIAMLMRNTVDAARTRRGL